MKKKLITELNKLKNNNLELDIYKQKSLEIKNLYINNSIDYLLKNYKRHTIGFKSFYLKYLYDQNLEILFNNLTKEWHIADYYYNKYLFARNKKDKQKTRYNLNKYLQIAKSSKYRYTHLYEDNIIEHSQKLYEKKYKE